MSDEKVFELSVEETNKLRIELGLAPLRTKTKQQQQLSSAGNDEEWQVQSQNDLQEKESSSGSSILELSVEATNALRAQIGLKPLNNDANDRNISSQGEISKIQHVPAVNTGNDNAETAILKRIQQSKLQRQVETNIQSQFLATPSLGEIQEGNGLLSWAQQMRNQQQQQQRSSSTNDSTKDGTIKSTPSIKDEYNEKDLLGLTVGHSVSELQLGSETVLTLQDAPLLRKDKDSHKVLDVNESEILLQNIDLVSAQEQQRGLMEKRKVELGMGRAGGYAGFDDDEFEELGGTQTPGQYISRHRSHENEKEQPSQTRGFQIGALLGEQTEESDLLFTNKAISLEPAKADVAASDFMTVEEYEALRPKKKKETKFKKKKKVKKDKRKTNRQHSTIDESDGDETTASAHIVTSKKSSLLDELEETATVDDSKIHRKRRRSDDDNDNDNDTSETLNGDRKMELDRDDLQASKKNDIRSNYDRIMAKGNLRSVQAFAGSVAKVVADDDEEPDDAFLNAALAKARRLNRLQEIKQQHQAEAVLAAVRNDTTADLQPSSGMIQFSVDETREFTLVLKAKAEQAEREQARKVTISKKNIKMEHDDNVNNNNNNITTNIEMDVEANPTTETSVVKKEDDVDTLDAKVDIHELAKQIKEEDTGLVGSTGNTVPIGRGVGNLLNLLKQTGEITRKNAGKEEMRGRAKDKRTYEDYEPLDLKQVVRIDERYAMEKDRELAQREVKLEYRDKHGRLLTRKEAFRDLSYQFHGYGSGKRKEEKKLEQIAREQAEARLASRQGAGAGSLGALKATQKATGKAFVIHKTGT